MSVCEREKERKIVHDSLKKREREKERKREREKERKREREKENKLGLEQGLREGPTAEF